MLEKQPVEIKIQFEKELINVTFFSNAIVEGVGVDRKQIRKFFITVYSEKFDTNLKDAPFFQIEHSYLAPEYVRVFESSTIGPFISGNSDLLWEICTAIWSYVHRTEPLLKEK